MVDFQIASQKLLPDKIKHYKKERKIAKPPKSGTLIVWIFLSGPGLSTILNLPAKYLTSKVETIVSNTEIRKIKG